MIALRNHLLLATCLLTFHACVLGQSRVQKIKLYNAVVSTVFQGHKYKGPLIEVSNSSITILSKGERVSIPSNSIKDIKFKRKGAVGRGALAGGLTGFCLGLIIGFASGDEECPPGGSWFCTEISAEEKAVGGGLALGAVGSVAGVIIGAASHTKKIKINGDQSIFLARKEDIRKYARYR
jgi:hypothetical protein